MTLTQRLRIASRLATFFGMVFTCLGTPLPGLGSPIVVRDARGVVVRLPAAPRRIVSLSPAVTETLFAIGAGDRVVGVTAYCDYPPEAKKRPKIGDYIPSIEKVLAQRPDLVVADAEANGRAVRDMERLPALRSRLFVVRQTSFRELFSAITAIGRVTGHADGAARVVRSVQWTLDAVRRRVARSKERPGVVFMIQMQPLWVVGSDTFMDEMIAAAGGRNLGRSAGKGFRSLSVEQLISLAPDVVVSTHASLDDLKARAGFSSLPAVRHGRVHVIGFEAVRPGPRIGEAVRRLADWFHPGP